MSRELVPCQIVTRTPITLSGEQTIQGIALEEDVHRVLVAGQPDPKDNGPRLVKTGGWVRTTDFDEDVNAPTPDMLPHAWTTILQSDVPELVGSVWYFSNPTIPDLSANPPLSWVMRSKGVVAEIELGEGLEFGEAGEIQLPERPEVAGTWSNPVQDVNDRGIITDIRPSDISTAYIEGLGLVWIDASTVGLREGAAYVPGPSGRVVTVGSDDSEAKLVGSDIVYYAYLREIDGEGKLELSSTPPDEPYFGSARIMTGNASRRYLGMIRHEGTNVGRFEDDAAGGSVFRLWGNEHIGAGNYTVISGYDLNTMQSKIVGPAGSGAERLVGPSTRLVLVAYDLGGSGTTGSGSFGNPMSSGVVQTKIRTINGVVRGYAWARLDNAQRLYYVTNALSAASLSLDIAGYYERR